MLQLKTKKSQKTRSAFIIVCSVLLFALFGCGGGGGGGGPVTPLGNTAPVAADGTLTVALDTATNGTLSASDVDAGDTLTYAIVTNGTKGTATITDAATGAYTYTPNAGATGSDTFTFKANDGTVDSNTATVSVTISTTGNTNPTAAAGDDQTVAEMATVNLTGSGTDAESTTLTYSWSQTGTPAVNITDNGDGTASFIAPAVDADTPLTFTMTVDDGAGGTATDDVVVTVQNAVNLSGTVSKTPQLADLAAEGTIDWMHWGRDGNTSVNQMTGVDVIADNGEIGTSLRTRWIQDAPATFKWNNGTAVAVESDGTITGIAHQYDPAPVDPADFQEDTNGHQVTITFSDTAQKRVNFYIGAFQGKAKLAVFWNSETTAAYDTIIDARDTQEIRLVTLDAGAQTAGDTLTIRYTIERNPLGSYLSLYALTVAPAKVPTPVISAGSGTYAGPTDVSIKVPYPENAAIYYTTDGSTPTQSSTKYAGQFTASVSGTIKARAFLPGYAESDIATSDLAITDAASSIKAAFVAVPDQIVDLEAEGTAGWVFWGRGTDLELFNIFDGGAGLGDYQTIGNVTATNGPSKINTGSTPLAFVWTNGNNGDNNTEPTEGTASTGARTGIFYSFQPLTPPAERVPGQDGVRLAITAVDTTQRTLKLYIGAFDGSATATVTIGGETFSKTITAPSANHMIRVLTVDYQPTAVGETLTVDYTIDNNPNASNLSIYAASLE